MIKSRTIAYQKNGEAVKGFTIPKEYSIFFENTYCTVTKSGASITYTSGAQIIITKKEIDKYTFQDCRI